MICGSLHARIRAAFRLFEPVFPLRTRTLVSELRWLAGLLGGVRDLDIQLAWLTTWSDSAAAEDQAPLWHLSETLETRRQHARRKLLQGLDSNRYERLVTRLTRLLQSGPPRRSRAARTPALAVVPGLIELRAQSAVKGGKGLKSSAPPEAFHRLRIRCKRLRYAIENARDLYGAPANDYIQDLVRIQDVLGLHQDAVVASGRLQELLHTSPRLPPRVIFTMGRAAQRYDQQAARLRKRFLKVYPRLQGKNWTRLKKAMDKGQAGLVTTEWPPPPRSAAPPSRLCLPRSASLEILIVRHAPAMTRDPLQWPDDRLRPLSPKGERRFAEVAQGLAQLIPQVDRLLTSPWLRARQTAEILQREADWKALEVCDRARRQSVTPRRSDRASDAP